ncbi:hypothetical protein AURDEDRAFT_169095 [Auricularia subglabra TFB-10046 SS5]|nr:hypothetical protein AURDEDRAFT_169095 [Auricularia subglabra TFB-10046 SS5]
MSSTNVYEDYIKCLTSYVDMVGAALDRGLFEVAVSLVNTVLKMSMRIYKDGVMSTSFYRYAVDAIIEFYCTIATQPSMRRSPRLPEVHKAWTIARGILRELDEVLDEANRALDEVNAENASRGFSDNAQQTA